MISQSAKKSQKPSARALALSGAACVLGLAVSMGVAQAANQLSADEQYRIDIERCESGASGQDIATCKKEAAAALQAARQQNLIVGAPNYSENATVRCEVLPAELREQCIIQMSGATNEEVRTLIEGSVESGGILRRTEIITPSRVIKEGVDYVPDKADPARIREAEAKGF